MCAEQDPTSRRYAAPLHARLPPCRCMALMYRSIGCCLDLRSASCSTTPTTTTRRGSSFGSPPTEAGVSSPSPIQLVSWKRGSQLLTHSPNVGPESWTNPHSAGRLRVTASSIEKGDPVKLVSKKPSELWSGACATVVDAAKPTLRTPLSLTLCGSVQATYRRRGSPSTWDPAGKRLCQASLTFSFVACLMRPHGDFERMPAHSCPTTTPYGTAATTRPTACAHGIYKVRASQCSESAIGLTTLTTTTLVWPYAQDRATVRPGSCSSDTPTTLRSPARSPPTHGPFPQ
jgi:hypothetical protein